MLHEDEASVKFTPVMIVGGIVAAFELAGCQHQMTLEEARAACTQQGGFLVVIYTQKITVAGVGPQVATPGNCASSSSFTTAAGAAPAPASAPPVSTPPASPAPAANMASATAN